MSQLFRLEPGHFYSPSPPQYTGNSDTQEGWKKSTQEPSLSLILQLGIMKWPSDVDSFTIKNIKQMVLLLFFITE